MKKKFILILAIISAFFLISCKSNDAKIHNKLIKNGLVIGDGSKLIYANSRKIADKSESIIAIYDHDEKQENIFEKQFEKHQVSYKTASAEEKEKFLQIFNRQIKKFNIPEQYQPDLSKDEEYIWQYNLTNFYLVYFDNIKRLFVVNLSIKGMKTYAK